MCVNVYISAQLFPYLLKFFMRCNRCFIVARHRSAYCRFPCMVIYMYIEFSPPDFPAVVNTSEGIRCTHLYTSSPTWTTVVSPTKRFSWTFSAVLVKSTCPMKKCGFTEEPNSLCCMFLCMSASCMTLIWLFSLYPIFCFFFSLSQHDNQLWGCKTCKT